MEDSLVDEFAPISVDDLSLAPPALISARFVSDDQSGGPQLRFHLMGSLEAFLHLDLRGAKVNATVLDPRLVLLIQMFGISDIIRSLLRC
ncbi:hypothetical protein COCNU_01G001900 [Cocos nucifera]|uniref:Uncharacterized protein n=1 Tax=Cocos nucifera TaxID=13894 RepID=A0A8K0HSQ3_COCNU|nr:hypothetical protein COCNU_01G001900 [Cocos nucifera]